MKKLILIIGIVFSAILVNAQIKGYTVEATEWFELNGEKFSLLTPIDGQVMQRVGGEWINASLAFTGEVTGGLVLTIADGVVDEANMKISNAPTNDYVLTADNAVTGGWKWAATSGGISGSGTDNVIPRWNGTTALEDGSVLDNSTSGTSITIGASNYVGIGVNPLYPFHIENTVSGNLGVIWNKGTGAGLISLGAAPTSTSTSFSANANDGTVSLEVLGNGAVKAPRLSTKGATTNVIYYESDGELTYGAASASSSPLTTKGDLFTFSTVDTRLPIGANNYVLTADATQATGMKWAPNAAGGQWQGLTGAIAPNTTTDEVRIGTTSDLGAEKLQLANDAVIANTAPYLRFNDTDVSGLDGQEFRIRQGAAFFDIDYLTSGGSTWTNIMDMGSTGTYFSLPIGVDDYADFKGISTPSNANTGYGRLWTATDGKIYYKYDTGTTYDLTAGSTGLSDPMTTRGDIIYRNASNVTARLPIGANSYVLTSDGTDVSWAASASSGGAPTDATYITQTSDATLTNEQALSLSGSGFMKNTTGTGVISTQASINLANSDVTGNLPVTNLNSGTSASSTTFWRGDGTWATPAGGGNVSTSGSPVINDFAKFVNGTDIEGRSYAETKTDLSLNNVENTALSTWAGTNNITTLGTVTTGTWNGNNIPADHGGTNISTYVQGDILYAFNSTTLTKLSIGTAGQVLTSGGSAPTWQNPSTGFADPMTTIGDIIIKDATNTTTRLGIGTNGQVLQSDGTNISWQTPAAGHDAVTLNTNATAAGLSLNNQEINYQAATNAQNGYMTSTLVGNIETNNDKLTNATHTGEVTGSGALTIADNIIEAVNLESTNSAIDGYFPSYDVTSGGFTWEPIAGGGVSFGTTTQIPYTNAAGTDFLYSSNMTYNGSDFATPNIRLSTLKDASGIWMFTLSTSKIDFLRPFKLYSETTALAPAHSDGLLYFNTTDSKIYGSIGGAWVDLGQSGGASALNDLSDAATDATSVFLGSGAGAVNDGTSNYNTSAGINTLAANTSGYANTSMGFAALPNVTVSHSNSGYGSNALFTNITGNNNTAIGDNALYSTTGGSNIGIGAFAGDNITSGGQNTFIGTDIDAPSATANGQVSINNTIFATGATGTGTTIATGAKVGINKNNPAYNLDVAGDFRATIQINIVDAIADKTANFTVDCSSGDFHTLKLTKTGGVTITLTNAVAGAQGTIFIYDASGFGAPTVVAYSDAGSTGLDEVTIGNTPTGTATKFVSLTYSSSGQDEDGSNGNEIFLVYGQEQ